jgi:hypothetical protein
MYSVIPLNSAMAGTAGHRSYECSRQRNSQKDCPSLGGIGPMKHVSPRTRRACLLPEDGLPPTAHRPAGARLLPRPAWG